MNAEEPVFAANQIVIPHCDENITRQRTKPLQAGISLFVHRRGVVRIPLTTLILPLTPNVQRFSDIALLLQELLAKSGSYVPCLRPPG